jgi:hypothetical protein
MEVSGEPHALAPLNTPPREKSTPVLIGYTTEWAPEPVWTLWTREKSHTLAGD